MMNPAGFANIAAAEQDFWWYRGMRQILFRMLDPIARERDFHRVLEAGCGTGHFAFASRYELRVFRSTWDGRAFGTGSVWEWTDWRRPISRRYRLHRALSIWR